MGNTDIPIRSAAFSRNAATEHKSCTLVVRRPVVPFCLFVAVTERVWHRLGKGGVSEIMWSSRLCGVEVKKANKIGLFSVSNST